MENEKLIIGIVDNRGLTFIGKTDMKKDENGMITMHGAQCLVKWWTGAHLGHLISGACDGVALGAPADIKVKEFFLTMDIPFESVGTWMAARQPKGVLKEC